MAFLLHLIVTVPGSKENIMKKLPKYLMAILAVMTLTLLLRVPVLAFEQTGCTEKTVTFKWNSEEGIDKVTELIKRKVYTYTVKTRDGRYASKSITENGAAEYSVSLSLPANYTGYVDLVLDCDIYLLQDGEYKFSRRDENHKLLDCYANTRPARPTRAQFGISEPYVNKSFKNITWFKSKAPNVFYKTELQLYKGDKYLKTLRFAYGNSKDFKLTRGSVYQYRIRYYYYNEEADETFYSAWSPWRGLMVIKTAGLKVNPKKKGYILTLGKAAGVSRYTVYSSLKKSSGYKKAKTFKAKSSKVYSVKVTKGYKKKKKNYIRINPYLNLKYYKGPSDISLETKKPVMIYK